MSTEEDSSDGIDWDISSEDSSDGTEGEDLSDDEDDYLEKKVDTIEALVDAMIEIENAPSLVVVGTSEESRGLHIRRLVEVVGKRRCRGNTRASVALQPFAENVSGPKKSRKNLRAKGANVLRHPGGKVENERLLHVENPQKALGAKTLRNIAIEAELSVHEQLIEAAMAKGLPRTE